MITRQGCDHLVLREVSEANRALSQLIKFERREVAVYLGPSSIVIRQGLPWLTAVAAILTDVLTAFEARPEKGKDPD